MEGGSAAVLLALAEQPLRGLDVKREGREDVRGGQAGSRGGEVTALKKATLALAGGEGFEGTAVGAEGETIGEGGFKTNHTRYQEILTHPSYVRPLVTFTASQVW